MIASPRQRLLLGASCVLATLLHAIDSTIISVALPQIQGSLQATQDQAAWVATAYIVSAAIMVPLMGWLGTRFGLRRVLLASISGFTALSLACGAATSMTEMVIFRALQGGLGAALIPLSQVTLLKEFPRESYVKAMSVWATASMVGPIIGPTAGGYLTDEFSWRWAFYINLPIGILAWLGIAMTMPKRKPDDYRPFDLTGFVLIGGAIGLLQLMLDRGQTEDWFDSTEIIAEAFFAAVFFFMFLAHSLTRRHSFIELGIFRDRNFSACLLIQATIGAFSMTPSVLTPSFLQQLQGHTPAQAGLLVASRGLSAIGAMFVVGRLPFRMDARVSMISGVLIVAGSLWWIAGFSLETPAAHYVWSGVLLGFGMPLTFIPTQIVAFDTLPDAYRSEAGVLLRLGVSLGSAAGVAVSVAQLARYAQAGQSLLTENFTPYSTYAWQLAGTQPGANEGTGLLLSEVQRQALGIAYADVFRLLAIMTLLSIPLILLLRPKPAAEVTRSGTPARETVEPA